jgi:hypothetical protein
LVQQCISGAGIYVGFAWTQSLRAIVVVVVLR